MTDDERHDAILLMAMDRLRNPLSPLTPQEALKMLSEAKESVRRYEEPLLSAKDSAKKGDPADPAKARDFQNKFLAER